MAARCTCAAIGDRSPRCRLDGRRRDCVVPWLAQFFFQSPSVEATARGVHNTTEIEDIIKPFAQQPNGGLVILPNALTVFNRSTIISLARQHRLPDIYALAESVAAGGLLSYGLDWDDQFRHAAEYVDKILKGAKPADLPAQAPTKFALTVNLRTANTLGLSIPPSLLGRADEVIE